MNTHCGPTRMRSMVNVLRSVIRRNDISMVQWSFYNKALF